MYTVTKCIFDYSSNWIGDDEAREGGPEDDPVELVEETKLRLSSDDQAFAGVVDEDVTEEKAEEHGAEKKVTNDHPGEHEKLTPE